MRTLDVNQWVCSCLWCHITETVRVSQLSLAHRKIHSIAIDSIYSGLEAEGLKSRQWALSTIASTMTACTVKYCYLSFTPKAIRCIVTWRTPASTMLNQVTFIENLIQSFKRMKMMSHFPVSSVVLGMTECGIMDMTLCLPVAPNFIRKLCRNGKISHSGRFRGLVALLLHSCHDGRMGSKRKHLVVSILFRNGYFASF